MHLVVNHDDAGSSPVRAAILLFENLTCIVVRITLGAYENRINRLG